MKQINTQIDLRRAHNLEHYFFHLDCLGVANEEFALKMGLNELRKPYVELLEQEEVSQNFRRKLELTDEVVQTEKERHSLFVHISQYIETTRRIPIPALAEAAERLWSVIRPWSRRERSDYSSYSAIIAAAVTLLRDPKHDADVQLLNLGSRLAMLKEKNDHFSEIYEERSGERYLRQTTVRVKAIRLRVDAAARAYFEAINAFCLFYTLTGQNPERQALLESVIDTISPLVYNLKTSISSRRKRSARDAEEEE